jgi:hypothetical protein
MSELLREIEKYTDSELFQALKGKFIHVESAVSKNEINLLT